MIDEQFDDEIRQHLRLLADRFVAQGISREEAALAARREFGVLDADLLPQEPPGSDRR
jgi:hypothetical protein